MANVEQVAQRKGPSLVIQLAMLGVMTVAAIGMGWVSGGYLKGTDAPASVPVAPENEGNAEKPAEPGKQVAGPTLVQLAPITTNLASPADIWIRLEASVVYDAPQPPELTEARFATPVMFFATHAGVTDVSGLSGRRCSVFRLRR